MHIYIYIFASTCHSFSAESFAPLNTLCLYEHKEPKTEKGKLMETVFWVYLEFAELEGSTGALHS